MDIHEIIKRLQSQKLGIPQLMSISEYFNLRMEVEEFKAPRNAQKKILNLLLKRVPNSAAEQ